MIRPMSLRSFAVPAMLTSLVLATGCGDPAPAPSTPEVTATGTIPRDTLNGPQVQQLPDGTVLRGVLRDGHRQGIWRSFTPQGRLLSQTEYRDGRPHGPVVVFHTNGSVRYLGQNHHGTAVGEWRFHDEAGALIKTVVYDSTGTVTAER